MCLDNPGSCFAKRMEWNAKIGAEGLSIQLLVP